MDDILADLLKSAGRIEEKIDNFTEKLDNHEKRLNRLEKISTKIVGAVTVVTLPLTFLWHRYVKKDA